MKKVKSGIKGLDEMLHGGIIEGRPYLISGGPGSGKSILGVQFLLEGEKVGERGVFVTLEEPAEELIENMKTFHWDLSNVKILELTPKVEQDTWFVPRSYADAELNILTITDSIKKAVEETKAKRIVIDSISTMKALFKSEYEIRKIMLSFIQFLSDMGCTSLLISEVHDEREVESFLARGVIRLHNINDRGIKKRAIEIEKMRGSDFDEQLRPMKITENGIVVYPNDTIFK